MNSRPSSLLFPILQWRTTLYAHRSYLLRPNYYVSRFFSVESQKVREKPCWSCKHNVGSFTIFCTHCNKIQSLSPRPNYFELFKENSNKYSIDITNLKKSYFNLQKALHPDLYQLEDETEKRNSEEISAFVNRAYNTLQSNIARATYMLELHGEEIRESDNYVDPELLMEVMEIQERLQESQTQEEANTLIASNKKKILGIEKQLDDAFQNKNLEDAKKLTIELRYRTNLGQAMHEWEPGKELMPLSH